MKQKKDGYEKISFQSFSVSNIRVLRQACHKLVMPIPQLVSYHLVEMSLTVAFE